MTHTAAFPPMLNLGSGKKFYAKFLNADIDAYWRPDIVWDFNETLPDGQAFFTERFGEISIAYGSLQLILAQDVLEHLVQLRTAMTTCLNLLALGGEMHIVVPYDLSYGAWQDPTHVRAFNERSWWYYTNWYWYTGWTEARFDLAKLELVPSGLGKALQEQGSSLEEIALTPRTIDEMHVILKKRLLTDKEKDYVNRYLDRG